MSNTENAIPYPDGEFWEELRQLYLESFSRATRRAVGAAGQAYEPYGSVLRLLQDCPPPEEISPDIQYGATYKQLAFIAHRVHMSSEQRRGWYEVAKAIPLSGRHAGHIIGRLDDRDEIAELERMFQAEGPGEG